ncbi:MAG: hypothetical protein JNK78_17255 [Planctomycetes bacterium]|nr:hypothetical protein [Planctomycetota bacterium]
MSDGSRPGGLTALAVINFVVGAGSLVQAFGSVALLVLHAGRIEIDDAARKQVNEVFAALGERAILVQTISAFVSVPFLVVAGVGYLRQSRVWGRGVGNAYALQSLAFSGVLSWMIGEHSGENLGLGVVLWIFFPLVTLFLLNTTFREDFVR